MQADVVISTLNNVSSKAFSLRYVIRSLLSQTINDLNIIVADNGSNDETSENIKREFGQKVNVLDTTSCLGNISASRNAAAECGKSDFIFFIDDDMVLATFKTLEKSLAAGEPVDFACGAYRLWAPLTWPKIIRPDDPILKIVSTLEQTSTEPHSINRISGKNILDNRSYIGNFGLIKRSIFVEVGGFDETYYGWGYQDTDLMWRLCIAEHKYDLFSRHDITVFHLSHKVNKGEKYEINRRKFFQKQKLDGRLFKTNHFFEIYENDGYSLFSEFQDEKIA